MNRHSDRPHIQAHEFFIIHIARRICADSLKNILNRDVTVFEPTRQDRAAIHENRRHIGRAIAITPGASTTSGKTDNRIIAMPADKFDGIGDDFTADKRGLHPLMPHGDTVSNGDGGEFRAELAFQQRLRPAPDG